MADRWTLSGHLADGDPSQDKTLDQLEHALAHLYDPVELSKSPFVDWFHLERQVRPVVALRRRLMDAIEALRPSPDVPVDSNAWRYYHLLSQRYVGRFAQADIAANLSISARQLRRIQPLALQALADLLASQYSLRTSEMSSSAGSILEADALSLSRQEEIGRLHQDQLSESTDLCVLLRSALDILAPLAREKQVRIECDFPQDLPVATFQFTTTRHALLNLLSVAVRHVDGGALRVEVDQHSDRLQVRIQPEMIGLSAPMNLTEHDRENIRVARELLAFSSGAVEISIPGAQGAPFAVSLSLPAGRGVQVLVIDDNVDALQLFQRFLAGTRYRFVGSAEPSGALSLAEELQPQFIVLDLMLPRKDGWELLGQFRAHPQLCQVPVIVCTVLPQEDLAMALGAAGFIKKPVNRTAFLAALDSVTSVQGPRSS